MNYFTDGTRGTLFYIGGQFNPWKLIITGTIRPNFLLSTYSNLRK